jgi:hypothetical protein
MWKTGMEDSRRCGVHWTAFALPATGRKKTELLD